MRPVKFFALLTTVTFLAVVSAIAVSPDEARPPPRSCSAAAMLGEPTAVISDLPTYVSNGTPTALDGSSSSDLEGYIVSYSWNISTKNSSTELTGISVMYTFVLIDEYEIELTVTDEEGMSDVDFEAVITVLDSDDDNLPDWWEQEYFGLLSQGPEDDYDSDGYSNAEELDDGTNPALKDPGPGILERIPVWGYAAMVAVAAVVVFLLFLPKMRRTQKRKEKQKIQYALEIEKALEQEEKK